MSRKYWWTSLIVACFCVSCGEESSKSVSSCDLECLTNQTCVDGVCQDKSQDEKSCVPECPEGQICKDGSCENSDLDNEPEEVGGEDETQNPEEIEIIGGDVESDETDIIEDENAADDSFEIEPLVTPLSGLETTTSGGKVTFTVVLNHKPENSVNIPVKSSNETLGTVDPSSLAFDAENWETPQTVTVTGGTKEIEQDTEYSVVVGPMQGDDSNLSSDEIAVGITQIKEVQVDPNVDAKSFELYIGETKVSGSNVDIFRGGLKTVKAVFTPENASDQTIEWSVIKCGDSAVDLSQVAKTEKKSSISLRSLLDAHHTFCLNAINDKLNMTKKVTFKAYPYLDLGLKVVTNSEKKYTNNNIRYYKDFSIYNNNYNTCEKNELTGSACTEFKKNGLGDIPTNALTGNKCKSYFSDDLAKKMNDEMYKKFIRPAMYYDGKGNYYGTRASVVAAARFLVLQFPYDIPYMMWGVSRNYSSTHPLANTTLSHYSTSLGGKGKSETAAESRIYGLNLTTKAYQDRSSSTVARKDAVPWGCLPECDKTSAGKACIPSGKKEESPNGLECGGLVSWALRNGGMRLGDTTAGFFGLCDGKCAEACPNAKRKYQCKDYVNGVVSASAATRNNTWDKVYEKLNKLSESDIIDVYKLNEKQPKESSQIKAGDLLHRSYTKKDGTSAGHIAMVLGVYRNSSDEITTVYVAEAVGKTGNNLKTYSWKNFREDAGWGKRFCKDENGKDKYAKCESHLIRMDKVYNYKKETAGADLNSVGYTDFWH